MTTETKQAHTPGPWSMEPNGACFNLRSPDRASHFCILIGMVGQPDGEHAANAHLIAAAPDLLDALEMAMPALEWTEKQWADSPQRGEGIDVMTVVRTALAKARGEG